ncbi:MAG TPA: hypothetical protein VE931_01760 [Pyrinomonadaceae bacterium]|nr:hypothetical protein [Pyrinomonadaceae bacterium]
MVRRMFLLVMLGTFLAIGGFWALQAQDPAPQQPATQTTTPTEKQTMPKTTQLDLSGTYAGTFANCEGLNGDTTLTITGDQFTTSDGKSGRIIASKTKGYTAVALQMSGANSKVMSFRGKKSGNKLTLSPVAGSTSQCMFTTSKMAKTPTATGTEVANPTTTTPSTTPSQNPSPSPSPTPDASPEPNPSPSGSPRPAPSPSEPAPSPTPTPSPSPRIQ